MNSQVEPLNGSFSPKQAPSIDWSKPESGKSFTQQVSNSQPIPLSLPQQRLWFLEQINPETAAHNLARASRLRGRLNLKILQQAVEELICRHQSLRTSFDVVETYTGIDGQPRQVIHATASAPLSIVDLSNFPPDERQIQALRVTREETLRPFRLSQLPLFRLCVLRLGEEEHILLLIMHLMISDDWSIELFLRELGLLYEAFSTASGSQLAPLTMQYADYAVQQRESLSGGQMTEKLAYWRQKLAAAPALLALPTDRVHPRVQRFRGGRESLTLSLSLSEKLKELSKREDVTSFMTLLTGLEVLLFHYARQEDITVGTHVANRSNLEAEALIGLMANTLVIRVELSGNPTFNELLKKVKEEVLRAYAHQGLPFEKLVQELRLEPTLSRPPLFQVSFNLRGISGIAPKLPGLDVSDFEFDTGIARLELALEVIENDQGFRCLLEYNTDLFDATTISRMLRHYQTLLENVVANPDQHLLSTMLLSDTERNQLLKEWNDTKQEYPERAFLLDMFERQAERTPNAVAVSFEDRQITYSDLDYRTNQLARYLKQRGTGPDQLVAICVERTADMVVGLLGILKAGAAYVPLDPTYPADRLSLMLEDSAANVLLTQQHLLNRLPQNSAKVICLDRDWQAIAQEGGQKVDSGVEPDNLVYVIYTSGSTGKPKGVAVTHRSVAALLQWTKDLFTPEEMGGMLASTSICFDLSVFELFAPLCCGGKVILANNAFHLPTLQTAKDITLINTVPSAMTELIRVRAVPKSVRTVALAGEALPSKLAQDIYSLEHVERVINLYGPSEDTTYSTFAVVQRGDTATPPIGRPIANTQVYILDDQLQPVPVGVPGELHLSGHGLARGYLKRPGLTAEKFIPNPHGTEGGGRLYKTGDLARYLKDGNIEFLGRIDHQVKIRGYRIELGEIEELLRKHPAVSESVVLAREDVPGEKQLVAYFVAAGEARIEGEIRSYLKEKLPEYMVPASFVVLESLPLTPNGKVDRRLLPAPDKSRSVIAGATVAPRDTLEFQLVTIWENLLNIQPLGVQENFFELGGDSLLALRLFAQIKDRFGKNLPMATLFRTPTIEQLAAILRQKVWSDSWPSLVAIQPNGSKPPLYCIHACDGDVLIYRPLVRHIVHLDQPIYGLQAQGLDGKQVPYNRIEDMAAHYIKEIRDHQSEGPYYLLGDTWGGLIAFEMALQLCSQGQKVAFLAMLDTICVLSPPLSRRLRGHLDHLLQRGLKTYVPAVSKAIKARFTRMASNSVNDVVKNSPSSNTPVLSSEDPLQRTKDAIFEAHQTYMPRKRLYSGRITYFRATDNQYAKQYEDNRLDWNRGAAGGIEVYDIPGRHDTMRDEPNVTILAERLVACLHKAQAAE